MKFLMKRFVALMAVFAVSYSLVHGAEAAAPAFEPLSDPESAEFRAFTQAKNREILEAYEVVRRERAALRTGAQSWPAIADNIHFNGAGFVQKGQIIYELIASLDVVKPNELTLLKHLCSYYNVLFLTVLRKVLAESPDRFYELNGRYHALLDHLFLIPDSRDVEQMRSKYGLMQEIALFMVSSLMLRAQHAVNQAFPVKERTKIATEMFIHQLFHEQEALADGSLTIGWYQFAMHKGAINSTKFPQDHMIEIFQPLVNVFNQRSLVGRVWDTVRPALPWVGAAALAAAYWYFRTPEAPAAPAGGAGVPPAHPAAPAGLAAAGAGEAEAPAAHALPVPEFLPHPPAPAAGGAAVVPPVVPHVVPAGAAAPAMAPAAGLLPVPDFAPAAWLVTNPSLYMSQAATWFAREALPVGVHNAGVAVRQTLVAPESRAALAAVAEAGGAALSRGALAHTATAEGAAQLQAAGSNMATGLGTPEARAAVEAAARVASRTVAKEARGPLRTIIRRTIMGPLRAMMLSGMKESKLWRRALRRYRGDVSCLTRAVLPRIDAANANVAAVRAELTETRTALNAGVRMFDQFCATARHPANPFGGALCPGYVPVFGEQPATAAVAPAPVTGQAPVAAAAASASGRRLLAPDAATSVVGVGPTASALGALPPAQRLESGLAARAADAAEPTMSRSWFWVDWWNQLASIGAAVSLE